ncbi:hypothetical protein EDB81DRAFT_54436 [Dactylonectria macrodidyma]|uniref:Uncharacterized protein n=1 Tax=Dactylonectria macrodidyma TaxID=307937 RepID=A0A9P9J1K0_9HYPO|nr:hypothetical protein EDB81DRAFT_54436 [Dactylonectria macrodidyma]
MLPNAYREPATSLKRHLLVHVTETTAAAATITSSLVSSSSTSGFFQQLPTIVAQDTSAQLAASHDEATDDVVLTRLLKQYLPAAGQKDAGNTMHGISWTLLEPAILRRGRNGASDPAPTGDF